MIEQDEENKVVVEIFGEEYPITGNGDPGYISKIARIVDTRMRQVSKSTRTKGVDKVAILTAMSFASELEETRGELDSSQASSTQRLDRLLSGLEHVLAESKPARS